MVQIFCSWLSAAQLGRMWVSFGLTLKTPLHLSLTWCVANNSLGRAVTQMSGHDPTAQGQFCRHLAKCGC